MAMMDGEKPYLLPFNYGYRDGILFIHSAHEGKKIELLKRNPNVCFEVEDPVSIIRGKKACSWSTRFRSVVGEGKAEILSSPESKKEGLEVIMAQHGGPELTDFEASEMEKMVILKITITTMTGKQSSNWHTHAPDPPPLLP
jgi:hypothetical protein